MPHDPTLVEENRDLVPEQWQASESVPSQSSELIGFVGSSGLARARILAADRPSSIRPPDDLNPRT